MKMVKIKNITNKVIPVNGKKVKPNKTIELDKISLVNYLVKNNVFEIIKQEKESLPKKIEIKEDIPEPITESSDLGEYGSISDELPKKRGRKKRIKPTMEDE